MSELQIVVEISNHIQKSERASEIKKKNLRNLHNFSQRSADENFAIVDKPPIKKYSERKQSEQKVEEDRIGKEKKAIIKVEYEKYEKLLSRKDRRN